MKLCEVKVLVTCVGLLSAISNSYSGEGDDDPFLKLPGPILEKITGSLSTGDASKFSRVNRRTQRLVNPIVWQRRFSELSKLILETQDTDQRLQYIDQLIGKWTEVVQKDLNLARKLLDDMDGYLQQQVVERVFTRGDFALLNQLMRLGAHPEFLSRFEQDGFTVTGPFRELWGKAVRFGQKHHFETIKDGLRRNPEEVASLKFQVKAPNLAMWALYVGNIELFESILIGSKNRPGRLDRLYATWKKQCSPLALAFRQKNEDKSPKAERAIRLMIEHLPDEVFVKWFPSLPEGTFQESDMPAVERLRRAYENFRKELETGVGGGRSTEGGGHLLTARADHVLLRSAREALLPFYRGRVLSVVHEGPSFLALFNDSDALVRFAAVRECGNLLQVPVPIGKVESLVGYSQRAVCQRVLSGVVTSESEVEVRLEALLALVQMPGRPLEVCEQVSETLKDVDNVIQTQAAIFLQACPQGNQVIEQRLIDALDLNNVNVALEIARALAQLNPNVEVVHNYIARGLVTPSSLVLFRWDEWIDVLKTMNPHSIEALRHFVHLLQYPLKEVIDATYDALLEMDSSNPVTMNILMDILGGDGYPRRRAANLLNSLTREFPNSEAIHALLKRLAKRPEGVRVSIGDLNTLVTLLGIERMEILPPTWVEALHTARKHH